MDPDGFANQIGHNLMQWTVRQNVGKGRNGPIRRTVRPPAGPITIFRLPRLRIGRHEIVGHKILKYYYAFIVPIVSG
jgi:hypothetical protein